MANAPAMVLVELGANNAIEQFHRSFLARRYFPALDGLRALSIIAVVWHHAAGSSYGSGLLSRGRCGVDLFFAISGFLITTLILREKDATGTIDLRKFYIRRSLRIFPLYYLTLLTYVVLVALMESNSPAGVQFFRNVPYFLTYTSNWFVNLEGSHIIFYFAWSLATEEQFYLFWPWVVRQGKFAPIVVMCVLVVATHVVEYAINAHFVSRESFGIAVLSSIRTPICLGALAAYAAHHRHGFRVLHAIAGQAWSPWLAFAFVLATLHIDIMPMSIVALAMTYLVVAVCLRQDRVVAAIFERKSLIYIGTMSYGIYLTHMLAMHVARRLAGTHDGPVVFLIAFTLSTVVATCSYQWVERRFLRLKDKFNVNPKTSTDQHRLDLPAS